jgi:hypothetical protein
MISTPVVARNDRPCKTLGQISRQFLYALLSVFVGRIKICQELFLGELFAIRDWNSPPQTIFRNIGRFQKRFDPFQGSSTGTNIDA